MKIVLTSRMPWKGLSDLQESVDYTLIATGLDTEFSSFLLRLP